MKKSRKTFAGARRAIEVFELLALACLSVAPNAAAAAEPRSEGAVGVTALSTTQRGTGQGTIVSISGNDVRIVTAKHVAVFGTLTIQFNGRSAPARILALIPNHDVAVIEATVDSSITSKFQAAHPAMPAGHEAVHMWGGRGRAPVYKDASVTETGGALPDGPAKGRFEIACNACAMGDSGSGIFDAHGDLVGIYVGYYTYDTGERVGVAEAPADAMRDAMTMPDSAAPVAYNGSSHHGRKLAGSNTNITQAAAITPRTGHPMPRFDFDFLISPLTKK